MEDNTIRIKVRADVEIICGSMHVDIASYYVCFIFALL